MVWMYCIFMEGRGLRERSRMGTRGYNIGRDGGGLYPGQIDTSRWARDRWVICIFLSRA